MMQTDHRAAIDDASAEDLRRHVYRQSPLSDFNWRERFIIRVADLFFFLLIQVICVTVRWEAHGAEHLQAIYGSGHRAIFTSWHACIFGATWFWRRRGIVVMSSRSRDAEYTARVIKRFGYGTARGSATRGGRRALTEMAACLSNGMDVGFTIDGPRGPAYVAKPGAVTLARHTGQAILPFHVALRRYWELPSWDRLQIPRPFTRAAVFVGEPIYVVRHGGRAEAEARQAALQATLDRLRREGEAWRSDEGKRQI
ncbi:MAG TPA: lysophospholipid acyltransferase family protein [Blastocatellia bacterium]|nr:lysophospholipid acyltransferase family protein [Blastocatellia bacterium]